MKVDELISVVNREKEINIISSQNHILYDGKIADLPPLFLKRSIKIIDIALDELFIVLEG